MTYTPLPYGTTRAYMASALHLAESVGSELFPGGSAQWQALMSGQAVAFTQAQVASLCPPDRQPGNLASFQTWTLGVNDQWTGS